MKATGVVRRIDELGRVVIPKEIRRNLRVREGDSLEIYVNNLGDIVLRKYSPIVNLEEVASQIADSMHAAYGLDVLVTDREAVVSAAGSMKRELLNKQILEVYIKKVEQKREELHPTKTDMECFAGVQTFQSGYAFAPILVNGDPVGSILILNPDANGDLTDEHLRAANSSAAFLGKFLDL